MVHTTKLKPAGHATDHIGKINDEWPPRDSHPERRSTAASEAVARQLGVGKESVRRWVVQAQIDDGQRPGVTTEENEEIKRLRAENRRLREDVAILKAATTFFAGELCATRRWVYREAVRDRLLRVVAAA